jgi:type I restriction enzyme S subunit
MLNSAYCYTQSQRYTHGIANRDLGLKRMVKIQMYLPPLDEQHRFAQIVEATERKKARQRADLAELDTLFNALVQRAFRGDL